MFINNVYFDLKFKDFLLLKYDRVSEILIIIKIKIDKTNI